jgi:hypothetical protein
MVEWLKLRDDYHYTKGLQMQKFTFVLDIVTDGSLDTDAVSRKLVTTVEGNGVYAAVKPVKSTSLKEQGFKVWRARVAGVTEESLNPKPKKVKAEKQTETAAS